jgi:hypothetical protein
MELGEKNEPIPVAGSKEKPGTAGKDFAQTGSAHAGR